MYWCPAWNKWHKMIKTAELTEIPKTYLSFRAEWLPWQLPPYDSLFTYILTSETFYSVSNFNEIEQCTISVTYYCIHRTVGKKTKKRKRKMECYFFFFVRIVIITIYWAHCSRNKYTFTLGKVIYLSNVNNRDLCLSSSKRFNHPFIVNSWKK